MEEQRRQSLDRVRQSLLIHKRILADLEQIPEPRSWQIAGSIKYRTDAIRECEALLREEGPSVKANGAA